MWSIVRERSYFLRKTRVLTRRIAHLLLSSSDDDHDGDRDRDGGLPTADCGAP